MIKKYIKGNESRGAEVIKALEELGGVNCNNHRGIRTDYVYYIDAESRIDLMPIVSEIGSIMQECFEEIKLPEQLNIVVKEPKQIYWFRATEDNAKNQALFDKLCDLVGINKRGTGVSDGIVYFDPLRDTTFFYPFSCSTPSTKCTIAMMIGKELVIDSL